LQPFMLREQNDENGGNAVAVSGHFLRRRSALQVGSRTQARTSLSYQATMFSPRLTCRGKAPFLIFSYKVERLSEVMRSTSGSLMKRS
jgi:hypothetical protein